jgi:hypothetical protein
VPFSHSWPSMPEKKSVRRLSGVIVRFLVTYLYGEIKALNGVIAAL